MPVELSAVEQRHHTAMEAAAGVGHSIRGSVFVRAHHPGVPRLPRPRPIASWSTGTPVDAHRSPAAPPLYGGPGFHPDQD